MLLEQLLIQIATECDLEDITLEQYRRALRKYGEHLESVPTLAHLQDGMVNSFLASLKSKGKSGTTITNYKSAITRVWNHAVSRQLCEPYDARRLRKCRVDRKPVRSWSRAQILVLIDACTKLRGELHCGVKTASYLQAWIRVAYDTGLRPKDMRMLKWSDIDFNASTITITQNKTKRPHQARLGKSAAELLSRIEAPKRQLVFPLSKGGLRRLEVMLFENAEQLGFKRMRGQGLGTLRKSHATSIYELEGESAAAESLGHVSGVRTVRASYIDSRAIKQGRLPPELVG